MKDRAVRPYPVLCSDEARARRKTTTREVLVHQVDRYVHFLPEFRRTCRVFFTSLRAFFSIALVLMLCLQFSALEGRVIKGQFHFACHRSSGS